MPLTIQSLLVGHVITEGDPRERDILKTEWTTGFYKQPVDRPLTLTTLGLQGDAVADTRVHGGPDKAILLYAASNYAHWAKAYPELKMADGAMAENLTVTGGDESTVCIGDTYQAGDCRIQVSQPRMPCWKISRRWGDKSLTKAVTQQGRTGWYARVLGTGMLGSGDTLHLIERPNPAWTIARANDFLFQREVDRMALIELMNLPELALAWKENLS